MTLLKLSLPRINTVSFMIGSWWGRTELHLTVTGFGNWHCCLISYCKTLFHLSLLLLNYKQVKDQQLFSISHLNQNKMNGAHQSYSSLTAVSCFEALHLICTYHNNPLYMEKMEKESKCFLREEPWHWVFASVPGVLLLSTVLSFFTYIVVWRRSVWFFTINYICGISIIL